MNDFHKGYKACLADVEVMLNASIKRNNGVKTYKEGFNVMNDVIAFTHTQELLIDAEIDKSKEQLRKLFVLGGM